MSRPPGLTRMPRSTFSKILYERENKWSEVIISHRIAYAAMCDRILMMENGRIIEQGTHNELMERNGQYAERYRQQSAGY